jgi:WD40 repeat protein
MKWTTMVLAVGFLVPLLASEPRRSDERTLLDVYGDPLPSGAMARFGSLRWRLPGAIEMAAVSPDGKQVAAVNMHGTVAVWEKDSGRLLHEIRGSKAGEASLAFSPDGQLLATGGRFDNDSGTGDFRVRIWDLKTGKIKTEMPAQNGSISKLVFTSDSRTLFSAGFDQPVIAWNISSGEKLHAFSTEENTFHNVALSPNDKWVAVSDNDLKTVTVYSFDGTRKLCKLKSKWNFFDSLEFTPDGKSLLTHEQGGVLIWDISSGKPQAAIPLEQEVFRKATLSPDGKKIALIGGDGRDIGWLDVATGKPLDAWKGRSERIYSLAFSRDGKTVVTGDWGVVRVWDASKGKVIQEPTGPDQICYALAFSANGKTVLAASYNSLYFLEGQTLKERIRIPVAMDPSQYPDYRFSVVLSPDGTTAAFLGPKDEIVVVDSRNPDKVQTLRRPEWLPASLAFSSDGTRLYALGHKSSGLRVWDLKTGKEGLSLDETLQPLSNLSIAHGSEKLAVVVKGTEPRCRLWDLRTGKEQPSLKLTNGPDKIMLSNDGKLLATYYRNRDLSVWDVAKQVELHRINVGIAGIPPWAFSDDGNLLVTSQDGVIRTWSMADGKMVAELRGHRSSSGIVALAVSPEDGGLVSGCTECTMLRWQKRALQGK